MRKKTKVKSAKKRARKVKAFDLKVWIVQNLRRMSYRFPARNKAKAMARVERGKYKCALCLQIYRAKEVQLDHLEPVIHPMRGFVDWNEYISRLLPDVEGWQVLCIPCHQTKSVHENALRRIDARSGK